MTQLPLLVAVVSRLGPLLLVVIGPVLYFRWVAARDRAAIEEVERGALADHRGWVLTWSVVAQILFLGGSAWDWLWLAAPLALVALGLAVQAALRTKSTMFPPALLANVLLASSLYGAYHYPTDEELAHRRAVSRRAHAIHAAHRECERNPSDARCDEHGFPRLDWL